jgi:hypothetical protein
MCKRFLINQSPVILLIFILLGINSCHILNGKESSGEPVHINRFDKDLFQWIESDTPELLKKVVSDYPGMLRYTGLSIFGMNDTSHTVFFDRIINYYSEPTLNKLYRDALKVYDQIETVEVSLGSGLHFLKTCFPSMQIPAVYMHVSGLQNNTLVADGLLSISIDKYLGVDYPLYRDHFPEYRRRKMTPENMVPDYLKAWLISEYPFKGNVRVLLDRMIYEGKIKYIIHNALPQVLPEVLLGFTSGEYQWCKRYEKMIWNAIIERKQLFEPDAATTERYFAERPSDFLSDDAPGDLGSWVGLQIVTKYMERTKESIETLMMNNDYQEILSKSRYKP